MAEGTIIAWADHTQNFWMGCTKVSKGCDLCYAETLTRNRMGLQLWGPDADRQRTTRQNWNKPYRWNRHAAETGRRLRVFCGSLMDWAESHEGPNAWREEMWEVIRDTTWLDWLMLTKRPGRIHRCLPDDWDDGWPHVWMGTSIEDAEVGYRADHLRAVPAAIRFVSYEPALGPLDDVDLTDIDWLIYGGESGPGWRDHDVQWARDVRTRFEAQGGAFLFKQSAAFRTEMGIELDGEIVRNYPLDRSPRGFETEPPRPRPPRKAPPPTAQLPML